MHREKIRVILAEDEDLARRLLVDYISRHRDLTIVAQCTTGGELARAIDDTECDLLLLDIRMPGADVFQVLADAAETGRSLPPVIFTTAYERYAVRAFEVNAVDYILKPFTAERFESAVGRVRSKVEAGEPGLKSLLKDLGRSPNRLLVPDRGRMIPIQVQDIDWIKAERDYARVYCKGKGYLVSRSLTDLEKRLDPERFIRIHRSAIVQADRIREVNPEGGSRFRIVLHDGTELIVSRTRAPHLRRWRP